MNAEDRNTARTAGLCTCVDPPGPCACDVGGTGCDCSPCDGAMVCRCAADCNCEKCQREDTLT